MKKAVLLICFVYGVVVSLMAQSPLCPSFPTTYCCEYISEVRINGVPLAGAPDATGFSSGPGYFDYTGSSVTALLAGQTYPVEVVAKTNNLYKEYVKIWFDFNGNGVLSDPNEMVFAADNSFNGTYVYAGNITIPSDAFNGEVYIRVVMVYNNSPALCGSYQYGTTMDIKATIMGGKVPRKLTVKVGEGEELRGRVESTPSGINTDKGLNSANFADSSVVTLTAFPAANAEFVNWEGDASGTNPVLTVNMDAAKDITARFALLPPPPSPTAITTASPAICEGETALLTVENAVGTVHWYTGSCGGDLVVTGNPISVKPSSSTVYYARNYTAGGFSAECASIEIAVAPKGVGGTISGENALICNGKSTGQMTLTGNVGVVQRWEKRVDGGEWQPITHTGEDYSETPSSVGAWDYRAVIKNGICSEVYSALWSVHVDGSAPIMTTPAADLTVCDQAGSNDLLNAWLANHGGANATDDYHSVTWSNNFDADNWTTICKNVKSQQVVFTATDACGYQSTTSAVFTVEDTAAVSIVCKDITLYLDASGSVSVPIDQMADVAVESCGFVSISVSPDVFYCSDVGENTVTLSVRDFCNNLTTCSAVVTVRDTLAPVFSKPIVPVLPKTISQLGHKSTYSNVRLNGGSNLLTVSPGAQVTLTANWSAAYDGGGGCGGCITQHHIGLGNIFSECHAMSSGTGTINKTFTAPVVPGIYYINQQATWWFYCGQFARPVHNNDHNTAIAVLVVADESFGACIPDFTVKTDSGSRRAVVNYFPPVAVDNCSSTTTQTEGLPSGSEFEFGTTLNTFVATDDAGNTSSCSFVVTVVDKEPPVALCKDVTVYLDEAGQASIDHHAVDNGSNDLFGIYSLVTSKVNFTCSDECSGSEESCPEVTLTVTDMNGNVSTCTSQVTVLDTIFPKALSKDITVFLDETGNVLITAADVDGGSSDACGIASMSVSPNTFTCEEVGENSVVLTVTDNNGNTSTATAVVTVEDKIAPEAVGKNITIQLDASGAALIVPPHIEAGSSDACGIASISVSPNVFTCEEVGENSVVLTVTDNNGNVGTATAVVTVEDKVAPVVVGKNITVQLDASGAASITAADVDGGSSDACGIALMSVSPSAFTCEEVGENSVVLTVTDNNGNVSTATAVVTVEDKVAPVVVGKNITVQLDASGAASIAADDVDGGSSDACGIASMSVFPSAFICENVGVNSVVLTVTDHNGNVSTATAVVTVEDKVAPEAVCKNITIQLNASGLALIAPPHIDGGSSDACGIASMSVSPIAFTCENVGENSVVLTVTDINGNVSTCTSQVTVQDTIPPRLSCSPLTIVLTDQGKYTLNRYDYKALTAGTTDNCTPYDDLVFNYSRRAFDCSQVGAPVELTISATDASGNVSVCTTLVTVEDHTLPVAQCQDVDVYLDINGEAFIFPGHLSTNNGGVGVPGWGQHFNDMEGGSYDACGIARMSIDRQLFGCDDVGAHTVTLTVEDPSGNQATCQATVTVHDTIAPVVSPVSDVTVEVAPGVCQTTVDYPQLTASDACPVSRELVSGLGSEGLFPVGTTTETWQFTDGGGNVVVVSFAVNVVTANSAPTLDAISDVTVDEDPLEVLIPLTGIGYGSDCASQALTITATAPANPVIQTMEVIYTPGETSGWLRITINPEQSGTADITVQVSDNGAGTTDGALSVEQHFTLTIRPVNDPPVLLHPVPDQVVHASYQLVLPLSSQNGELFADADAGDQLTLTVGLEGNQPLPSWLTFANDTLRAAPMLQDTGCVTVVVRAVDLSGAFVEDQFRLCVDGYPVGIGDIEKSSPTVRLYPNPTTGQVRVDLGVRMIKPVGVTVYNLTGREVFRRDYFSGEELTFDMSPYVTGLYLVKITVDGIPTVQKLVLEKDK